MSLKVNIEPDENGNVGQVQLTGSTATIGVLGTNYTETTIMNGTAITDTLSHSSTLANSQSYTEVFFEIKSTLNQSITVTLTGAGSDGTDILDFYTFSGTTSAAPTASVGAQASILWGPFKVGANVGVNVQATTTPTSGTVTVIAGLKRV